MTATVLRRPFADGEYPFRIGAGEARELQRICDCGPLELYRRLLGGTWRYEDVTETIRLGLLGAARAGHKAVVREEEVLVTPQIAVRLVREYVETYGAPAVDLVEPENATHAEGDKQTWAYSALVASLIIGLGLMGSKDEPLGKKAEGAGTEETPLSRTESSDGRPSSPPSPTEA